jgi:uncharacterized protein (DUF58 family)
VALIRDRVIALERDAEALSAALPSLLVAAERVATTVAQGVHGRRRVGQGETFWQFRRYELGDSPQSIDWRQSAKRDRVYVRQLEWEAAQSVWLSRDGSASMDYRSSAELPTKRERADVLALALAILLCGAGEHVALAGSEMAPSNSRSVIQRLALELLRPGDTASARSPALLETVPRHAHLVVIGDLLAPLAETEAMVRSFVERGIHGHLMQVLDPAEETLPFTGRVRFVGPEEEEPWTLSRVESVRSEYLSRLAAHIEGLRTLARLCGWSFGLHHTDRPPQAGLLGLYAALGPRRGT